MRQKRKRAEEHEHRRYSPRVHSLSEVSLNYEGGSEKIILRAPDISTQGMFINTTRTFPEGSILCVQFRLAISGIEVRSRCEVRYCLPGVGVGAEFVGITPQAAETIEQEVALNKDDGPIRTPELRRTKGNVKTKKRDSEDD
jgi:PilZ domain